MISAVSIFLPYPILEDHSVIMTTSDGKCMKKSYAIREGFTCTYSL